MLSYTLGTARDLGRLHHIVSVFVRHGLGDAVRRLGWAQALERAGSFVQWDSAAELARLDPPEQCAAPWRNWGQPS
jgi:ubiquinone biosynthesis protein